MGALFGLDSEQRLKKTDGRRFRSSYLRLLQDWGFDSNSPAGAVLKGWVESRFGLFPTFHKEVLGRFPSPGWIGYVEEKMSSRFHNNSINLQLDLLYEYSQWALARYFAPGKKHLTLYRGVNDFKEHPDQGTTGQEQRDCAPEQPGVVHLESHASRTNSATASWKPRCRS